MEKNTAINKYLKDVSRIFADKTGLSYTDVDGICRNTLKNVSDFTASHSLVVFQDQETRLTKANESLQFSTALASTRVDGIKNLVEACGVPKEHVQAATEQVGIIMDRCLGHNSQSSWRNQWIKASDLNTGDRPNIRPLNTLYSDAIVNNLENAPALEAFGVDIDKAVPDMNVSITVAIMNFHTRLAPRMHPVRSTTQPNVTYTKEYLEIYDLSNATEMGRRLVDLYIDPTFASNELKRIIPLVGNEKDPSNPEFLVKDNILKFGITANILKLSIADVVTYSQLNRTDLVAENVKIETVYVKITNSDTSEAEIFAIQVPTALARLTRIVNGRDSAIRNADIRFRYALNSSTVSTVDNGGTWSNGTTTLLAGLPDNESVVVDLSVKPSISLKFGTMDCLGAVSLSPRHNIDNDQLSVADILVPKLSAELIGYTPDARFSEENLRKTNMAVFSHRQPFSYDIPIGPNYVFDYAIGQANAESNATRLTEVCGLGQDHVDITICSTTIRDVHDQNLANGSNKDDQLDYIGAQYVAGDKVIPTCFIGTLDFTNLNIIRDADRSGDIIQKATSYLTAATSKILQESLFQQRLGGSTTVTFKGVTSPEILGNVIGMPHIHNHLSKDDHRNDGEGVEYVMVLPNGIVLKIITSTFYYMRDKLMLFPTVEGNAESDLHFAHLWDYGAMVAQYTPAGNAAHHRLFANIRQLPLVVNPVGLYITITGMDIVNGIATDGVLRPTVDVSVTGSLTTTASGDIYGG